MEIGEPRKLVVQWLEVWFGHFSIGLGH